MVKDLGAPAVSARGALRAATVVGIAREGRAGTEWQLLRVMVHGTGTSEAVVRRPRHRRAVGRLLGERWRHVDAAGDEAVRQLGAPSRRAPWAVPDARVKRGAIVGSGAWVEGHLHARVGRAVATWSARRRSRGEGRSRVPAATLRGRVRVPREARLPALPIHGHGGTTTAGPVREACRQGRVTVGAALQRATSHATAREGHSYVSRQRRGSATGMPVAPMHRQGRHHRHRPLGPRHCVVARRGVLVVRLVVGVPLLLAVVTPAVTANGTSTATATLPKLGLLAWLPLLPRGAGALRRGQRACAAAAPGGRRRRGCASRGGRR